MNNPLSVEVIFLSNVLHREEVEELYCHVLQVYEVYGKFVLDGISL